MSVYLPLTCQFQAGISSLQQNAVNCVLKHNHFSLNDPVDFSLSKFILSSLLLNSLMQNEAQHAFEIRVNFPHQMCFIFRLLYAQYIFYTPMVRLHRSFQFPWLDLSSVSTYWPSPTLMLNYLKLLWKFLCVTAHLCQSDLFVFLILFHTYTFVCLVFLFCSHMIPILAPPTVDVSRGVFSHNKWKRLCGCSGPINSSDVQQLNKEEYPITLGG